MKSYREDVDEHLFDKAMLTPQQVRKRLDLQTKTRCLHHCWHSEEQRLQGYRCLVACWQPN
jgi:hypothetical protein